LITLYPLGLTFLKTLAAFRAIWLRRICYKLVTKKHLTRSGLGDSFELQRRDRGCEMCEDFPCCGHDHGGCQ
jgi:hypothetical protein